MMSVEIDLKVNTLTEKKVMQIDSDFSAHRSEVLAAETQAAIRGGQAGFRFVVASGFFPTIGWLERLVAVIAPLVREKQTVEITCSPAQVESLHRAGIHLIADLTVSAG
jgi:hypothetical protein